MIDGPAHKDFAIIDAQISPSVTAALVLSRSSILSWSLHVINRPWMRTTNKIHTRRWGFCPLTTPPIRFPKRYLKCVGPNPTPRKTPKDTKKAYTFRLPPIRRLIPRQGRSMLRCQAAVLNAAFLPEQFFRVFDKGCSWPLSPSRSVPR